MWSTTGMEKCISQPWVLVTYIWNQTPLNDKHLTIISILLNLLKVIIRLLLFNIILTRLFKNGEGFLVWTVWWNVPNSSTPIAPSFRGSIKVRQFYLILLISQFGHTCFHLVRTQTSTALVGKARPHKASGGWHCDFFLLLLQVLDSLITSSSVQ